MKWNFYQQGLTFPPWHRYVEEGVEQRNIERNNTGKKRG